MGRVKQKINLRIKFFLIFIAITIIPLFLFLFSLPPQVERTLEQVLSAELGEQTQHVALALENFFDRAKQDAVLLSKNKIIISETTSNEEKLEELITLQKVRKIYDDVTLINTDGVVITSVFYSYRGEWASKECFKKAIEREASMSDAHIILDPKKLILISSAPVYDENHSVISVVALQIDMSYIWAVLDEYTGENRNAYILNTYGRLISPHPDIDILEKYEPEYSNKCNSNYRRYIDNRGTKIIEAFSPFMSSMIYDEEGCWELVFPYNEAESFSLIKKIKNIIFIIFFVVLFISFIISSFFSKSITKPIVQLVNTVKKISAGNFNVKSDIKTKDEIGELASSFNEMAGKLKESQEKIEEQNRTLKQKVEKQTRELRNKLEELEKFNDATVGRELRMIELKEKIKDLEKKDFG